MPCINFVLLSLLYIFIIITILIIIIFIFLHILGSLILDQFIDLQGQNHSFVFSWKSVLYLFPFLCPSRLLLELAVLIEMKATQGKLPMSVGRSAVGQKR